jgi:hypothetical protein
MEDVAIFYVHLVNFYGHLANFMAIWYMLHRLGTFLPFWYLVSRNIWQPWMDGCTVGSQSLF